MREETEKSRPNSLIKHNLEYMDKDGYNNMLVQMFHFLPFPIIIHDLEKNDGKIRVESELGQGSNFIFSLPFLME